MIQINCGVSGGPELPQLQISGAATVAPEMESPTRAIFRVDDGLAGKPATFIYGQATTAYVIPLGPGAYEGPLLRYQSAIELPRQLHGERDLFVDDQGNVWRWRGHLDMLMRKRSLEGTAIEPMLDHRYGYGSRVVATFEMWYYGEHFNPADYGDRFYDHMKPFARAVAARGFYWMPIIFTDCQVLMPNVSDQQRHFDRVVRELAGEPNILPSLGNEMSKNGWHASDFTYPTGTGLMWSRGSEVADTSCPRKVWDYAEFHPRRDWPKVLFGCEDGWYVKEGIDKGNQVDRPVPGIASEPIGWNSVAVPGRRSNDPALARVVGTTSWCYMRGSNAMTEQALHYQPWDAVTAACVQAQLSGVAEA